MSSGLHGWSHAKTCMLKEVVITKPKEIKIKCPKRRTSQDSVIEPCGNHEWPLIYLFSQSYCEDKCFQVCFCYRGH